MDATRVWADIDLDALAHNLGVIRSRIGAQVATMLVVKADAYGHGAIAVAHHAVRCGVEALGVGNSAEALELRQAGVCVPILVLGTIVDEETVAALRHDVQIGLHSRDRCIRLQDVCRRLGLLARVHLNVDTGWGQLGVLPERAIELLEEVDRADELELVGVMTHVSSTEGLQDPETSRQMERFHAFLDEARRRGLPLGQVHAANSACIFTGLSPLYDMVRPGISAYGVLPSHLGRMGELRPVMSLETQVVFLKDIPAGSSVGYGGTWRASRPTRIATLPVGYDDGVSWRLSNCGEVLVRGRRAPVVGRISMDYTTVDVGHLPGVTVGDRVTLFGSQEGERIDIEEVARKSGTIPYEVTCAVGKRVGRVYRGGPVPSPASANADSGAVSSTTDTLPRTPRDLPRTRRPAGEPSHEPAASES